MFHPGGPELDEDVRSAERVNGTRVKGRRSFLFGKTTEEGLENSFIRSIEYGSYMNCPASGKQTMSTY